MTAPEQFTGCRAFPTIQAVEDAIGIARDAAFRLAIVDLTAPLPEDFVGSFNLAVMYLLWHQVFAISTRAIKLPYIALRDVSLISGISVLSDKGSGHKTRLVLVLKEVREHMRRTELLIAEVTAALAIDRNSDDPAAYFLSPDLHAVEISPTSIVDVTASIFPFPTNSSRRVMRYLLGAEEISSERLHAYLGHCQERQEPWGRWSTFNYAVYLDELRLKVPQVLHELGFRLPPKRGKKK